MTAGMRDNHGFALSRPFTVPDTAAAHAWLGVVWYAPLDSEGLGMDMGADLPDGLKNSHRCWLEAVAQADLDGYVDLVVEDVVWIQPGQEALQGRAAFRRWLEPFFEQYTYAMSVRDLDIRVAGRWAVEKGTFHSRMTPRPDGAALEHTGRFIALWRHEADGKWRLDRYIDDTPEVA